MIPTELGVWHVHKIIKLRATMSFRMFSSMPGQARIDAPGAPHHNLIRGAGPHPTRGEHLGKAGKTIADENGSQLLDE
jgi:hypothetical protein